MPVADHTFSFRGPPDLGERLERARRVLEELQSPDERVDIDRWFFREFDIALLRRIRDAAENTSRGAFIRTVIEALVGATEKLEREVGRLEAYGAFAERDAEGEAIREAVFTQAAADWD